MQSEQTKNNHVVNQEEELRPVARESALPKSETLQKAIKTTQFISAKCLRS
jgi:hypothetical protein